MKAGKIVLDISMDEFKNYSEKTLSNMGLRTLRMNLHRDVKSAPRNVEKMILRDFSFSYEKEDAIIIPEISLQEGAVIAVIGKNGAGKSTFSRCLCGLEKKFKGKMIVGDKILQRKQLLKQCYMVMQDVNHQLFCESVKEEVQLAKRSTAKLKTIRWILISLCAAIVIIFIALAFMNSSYLDWNYKDHELAMAGTIMHGFEFLFVRIAPIVFLIFVAGIVVIYKKR